MALLPASASGDLSGPDVSSWQHPNGASVDWNQVRASGKSFAFVKATEGPSGYYTNPYFTADWAGIRAAGMYRGAYHFARPALPTASSAQDQANFFISTLGNTRERGDLPPALDLEVNGGLSPADLISWTQTFLSTVQSLTGRVPVIYSYPSFWRTSMNNTSAFTSFPLWLADWTGTGSPNYPLPGGWPSYTFWQYTSQASVPGIQGNVDMSRYCCDSTSLNNVAFGNGPPAATDLYGTLLNSSASGKVEIHALSRSSSYSQFFVHTATGFGASDPAEWEFFLAPSNGDNLPDLIGVHTRNTGSGMVEVHALAASSGYQTWIVHAATALPAVQPGRFQFALGSLAGDGRSNLYAIALNNTGSGKVEVHTLSEASNFAGWVVHAATALAPVASTDWQFRIGDAFGSGDLIGIAHTATGSGRTEIHALSRGSSYQGFTIHTATPLGYTTDAQFAYSLGDHDNDGIPDLYAVMMNGTGSGKTEVHVLSGASRYSAWISHAATGLGPTSPASWQFSTH